MADIAMSNKREVRTFESVVGASTYRTWAEMLGNLVPGGRTHRLAVVVAGMLQHAATRAIEKHGLDPPEGTVSYSLLAAQETQDLDEVLEEIGDLLRQLFEDAGVEAYRVNARGDSHSILEAAAAEYVTWYEMPWE